MKTFEECYEKEFPLPPTIERGPIGRDRKDGCKQSWRAALEWALSTGIYLPAKDSSGCKSFIYAEAVEVELEE